jgi:hypothetical protein
LRQRHLAERRHQPETDHERDGEDAEHAAQTVNLGGVLLALMPPARHRQQGQDRKESEQPFHGYLLFVVAPVTILTGAS